MISALPKHLFIPENHNNCICFWTTLVHTNTILVVFVNWLTAELKNLLKRTTKTVPFVATFSCGSNWGIRIPFRKKLYVYQIICVIIFLSFTERLLQFSKINRLNKIWRDCQILKLTNEQNIVCKNISIKFTFMALRLLLFITTIIIVSTYKWCLWH